MFTLAPSLFMAIVFGWTPWPHGSAPTPAKDVDAEERRPAAPAPALKLTPFRPDTAPRQRRAASR